MKYTILAILIAFSVNAFASVEVTDLGRVEKTYYTGEKVNHRVLSLATQQKSLAHAIEAFDRACAEETRKSIESGESYGPHLGFEVDITSANPGESYFFATCTLTNLNK